MKLLQEHWLFSLSRVGVVAFPDQEDVCHVVEHVDPHLEQIELVINGQGLDQPARLISSLDPPQIEVGAEEDLFGDPAVQAVIFARLARTFAGAVALQEIDAGREAFSVADCTVRAGKSKIR